MLCLLSKPFKNDLYKHQGLHLSNALWTLSNPRKLNFDIRLIYELSVASVKS